MRIIRTAMPVRQGKQLENAQAEVAVLREKLEKQNLTMKYMAEMCDVYIPEEVQGDEQNVYDPVGNEAAI